MRRKITRADEAMVRRRAREALGYDPELGWIGDTLDTIARINGVGAARAPMTCNQLRAAGLHPGADGWEIDEAPVPRPLPAGVAWYQHSIDEHRLEAGRRVLATVRRFDHGHGWTFGLPEDGTVWEDASSIDAAKAAAETACRSNGLFAAFDAPPEQPRPTGDAARTLRRLLSLAAREDEHGPIAAPAGETPAERAAMRRRLVDAFLAELGAEIERRALDQIDERAARAMRDAVDRMRESGSDPALDPCDRLNVYLSEHYRDSWMPGENAHDLAIRMIGDLEDALAAAREEAATSDANAVELAGKLDAAQKRIAEMGGDIDALQTALEAGRSATKMAESLRDGATRRAEKAEAELDAIRSKLAEIINAASARKGAAS